LCAGDPEVNGDQITLPQDMKHLEVDVRKRLLVTIDQLDLLAGAIDNRALRGVEHTARSGDEAILCVRTTLIHRRVAQRATLAS
jgi:hypothetical protein